MITGSGDGRIPWAGKSARFTGISFVDIHEFPVVSLVGILVFLGDVHVVGLFVFFAGPDPHFVLVGACKQMAFDTI